ncbi:MAG: hypothetical protein NTY09_13415 [bacterium]|nr:hypothetical protein [bacterium]
MSRWTIFITAIVYLLIVAVGCSNGNGTPVSPTSELTHTDQDASQSPDLTSQTRMSGAGNTSLMGYYDIYFDIQKQTFEVVEDRSSEFTLNIIPLLNKMTVPRGGITFGSLVVDSTDPAVLKVDVELEFYHPFALYDQFMVYDLMGVMIGDGGTQMKYQGLNAAKRGTDLYMTNADGYTRWFNPSEFTSTSIFGSAPGFISNYTGNAKLNPYKYYAMSLASYGDVWDFLTGGSNNDGLFESGDGRLLRLEFPMPSAGGLGLKFGYAVVCCWEDQGPDEPYTPYHRSEAVAISVIDSSDLWFESAGNSGGNIISDFNLYSWEEQPQAIIIESSVLTSNALFNALDEAEPGGENYSSYHIDVPADNVTAPGMTDYWIISECSSYDYKNGLPDFPSADGPLAAFFRIPVEVIDGVGCPTPVTSQIYPNSIAESYQLGTATITASNVVYGSGVNFSVKLIEHNPTGPNPFVVTGVPDPGSFTATTFNAYFDTATNPYPPAGTYDVWIINDCGTTYTSPQLFTVQPCPVPAVTAMSKTEALNVGGNTGPIIINVDNLIWGPGVAVNLSEQNGTTVITGNITNHTLGSITANFDILPSHPIGIYDVQVTNDCQSVGGGSEAGVYFTIGDCTDPSVGGIVPPCIYLGSLATKFTVTGSNFFSGPYLAVLITDGTHEAASTSASLVSGAIECTFDPGDISALPLGTYDVEVTNGCGATYICTAYDIFEVDNTAYAVAPYIDVPYDSTYDIRTNSSATQVYLYDEQSTGPIAIGFTFNYYGIPFDYFDIGSNGTIKFKSDPGDTTSAFPIVSGCGDTDTKHYVIPFGEDLDPSSGGNIRYLIQGSPGNQTLTVQWDAIPFFDLDSGYPNTFSATFFEGTGTIRFQYEDVDPNDSDDADLAIAECTFQTANYYEEEDSLFCSVAEWPTECRQYRAYEVDLPDATLLPPPPCYYTGTILNNYDSNFELYSNGLGTPVTTLGDDEYETVSINFASGHSFTYCGQDYTDVTISANGAIWFDYADIDDIGHMDRGHYCGDIDPIGDVIVATMDDLNPGDGGPDDGHVSYYTGTIPGYPYQAFIVEWYQVPSWSDPNPNTMQIILFDDPSADCDPVRIQWHDLNTITYDALLKYAFNLYIQEVCLGIPGTDYALPNSATIAP